MVFANCPLHYISKSPNFVSEIIGYQKNGSECAPFYEITLIDGCYCEKVLMYQLAKSKLVP